MRQEAAAFTRAVFHGKQAHERTRVLSLKDGVEPLLRSVAGHEIDTNAPLNDVVMRVLQLVQVQP